MSLSKDRISKPVADRYFPLSTTDIASRVSEAGFSVHDFDERLPILFENGAALCDRGHQLCSLLPRSYLAVFSLPEAVPRAMARSAIEVAIGKLAEFDRGPQLAVREQQFVVYRAFLSSLGALAITQHVVSAGRRKYLQFRDASKLSNAERETKGQLLLFSAQIT